MKITFNGTANYFKCLLVLNLELFCKICQGVFHGKTFGADSTRILQKQVDVSASGLRDEAIFAGGIFPFLFLCHITHKTLQVVSGALS